MFFHTNAQPKTQALAAQLTEQGFTVNAKPATGHLTAWELVWLDKPGWVVARQDGFTLPSEAELRSALQTQGRQLRSVMRQPEDASPSLRVTFESPYWRLPSLPEGHHRTLVN